LKTNKISLMFQKITIRSISKEKMLCIVIFRSFFGRIEDNIEIVGE